MTKFEFSEKTMGAKGPLRDPDSRRGSAEGLVVLQPSDLRAPEPPRYLKAKERHVFSQLIDEAQRAALTPLVIDAHLYAKIARMEIMLEREADPDGFLRIMRTLLACYQAAGMTEVARRRLGIRPERPKKGGIASILAAKQAL